MMHTQGMYVCVFVALVALYGAQAGRIYFSVGLHQEDVTPADFKADREDFTKTIQDVISTRLGISDDDVQNVVFSAWRPEEINWGSDDGHHFVHESDSSVDPANAIDSYLQFTVDFWSNNASVSALTYSNQLQMMTQSGAMTTAIQTSATTNHATKLQTSATETGFYNFNKIHKRSQSVKLTGTEIAGLCVGASLCFALLAVFIAFIITAKGAAPAPAATKETEMA